MEQTSPRDLKVSRFQSTGIIKYINKWIIVECDDDLARYYRKQLNQKALTPPPFGSHITVVAGDYETPTRPEFWNKYVDQAIEFEYEPQILSLDRYHWVTVYCEKLLDIREELGLNRNLKWPLHLTVAKSLV